MPWTCRMVEYKRGMHPRKDGGLTVGDMFYLPPEDKGVGLSVRFVSRGISKYYYENNLNRCPLLVIIPGPMMFCVDTMAWSNGIFYGDGWTVTGEAPNITMHPSINIGGTYHGWLQNGILSDDCEGRTYDEEGYQIRDAK